MSLILDIVYGFLWTAAAALFMCDNDDNKQCLLVISL